ncbi:hypothetical protein MKK88_32865 [Methylobacterium sp. E-005]|uniref:hypothetical protein n=1 Tax=Methylobacterium sp. E-005 TaxID=2836549 RepID=UPI001FB922AE|nr:hypothetical protein [Methylobacterium sp. E-005]MCJ2090740.1 hypothetical protein [Methylobacterium sp. E-005]
MENATIEILKGIQASLAQLRSDTTALRAETGARFDSLAAGLPKDRRNAAGMLVMMRATAGDFDARVGEVEERVAAFESRIA